VRPDPDQASTWVEAELSKPEYHQQGLLDRFVAWLQELWDELARAAAGAGELSTLVAVTLALLVVALALVVMPRIRRTPVVRSVSGGVLSDRRATAEQLRSRAQEAFAEGRHSDAVVETMRALARRMVDRSLLEETPGSTAHEIAVAVAGAFPGERPRLLDAAEVFDAVQYGGSAASKEQAASLLAVYDDLCHARPAGRDLATPSAAAVPR
jgi:hypothetical protein